jgi:DNA-binding CsgD family transcriptional regulator
VLALGSQPIRTAAIRWRVVADRLRTARDFVEVAVVLCEVSREQFEIPACEVTLNTPDGRRGVCVDNFTDVTDEDRLARISESRGTDSSVRLLREHHAPIASADTVLLPLLQVGGLLGSIRYKGALQDEQLRDLRTLATYGSVRLAQLGTFTADVVDLFRALSPRQREVARLVSYGRTNAEVGMLLAMSENTVKKHLKDIFLVLDLGNRTELAALLKDLPPDGGVPLGVTRIGDVTVARRR